MKPLPQPAVLFSAEVLAARVAQLGEQITRELAGRPLLVVGVLKGAALFTADLVRQLRLPVQLEFVRLSSYGAGTVSRGTVELSLEGLPPLAGRDVLVVEDIVDTGLSMQRLRSALEAQGVASVRLCTLLHKPARARVAVALDYVGFTIEDRFVVGYGLDYDEQYRHLPFVGVLPTT